MFSGVSWQQYFFIFALAIIVYYLAIWIIYFKAKLPNFNIKLQGGENTQEFEGNASTVIAEIMNVFKNQQSSTELIYALQTKLQNYKHWDEPGFRETINAYILGASEKECSIHLSEEELKAVWI